MNSANISTYTNRDHLLDALKASNEAFHRRLRKYYPCVDDVSQLPHGWSIDSKAPPLGLTRDNLGCYYRGNGRRDEDEKFAAAVRTDHHIPPSCLLYYFEIKFISKGREGFMGLGLTSASAVLNKLPGWVRESYGYHADDGNIFNGDGRGSSFGPTFTSGDVIGCGYNLVEGKCFFTKNGLNLGKAFDDIPNDILFYPTIGLKTAGEEIRANFGQEDFVYDIEQDLRSLRKNMTLTISNYPISDFGTWQSTLHRLVQSWLLQNSYPKTADAFTRSASIECKEDMQRIELRHRIQQFVLSGKISEAIKLTNRLCPKMLQNDPNLLFALKCRQFIELISGAENDFQPKFNHNDTTASAATTITTNDNNETTSNGTDNSNGIGRTDLNGQDQALPSNQNQQQPLAPNTDYDPACQHENSNNGCNGMIGDNNICEKVDDQHSTSSSSYQELMDVDQPNNNNDTNNHRHNSINNNSNHHRAQQSTTFKIRTDVNGSSAQQTMPLIDTEIDFNEQKFAKLIQFGQELCDYLQQLDKLYGKNETNEKMLREAIGLIAFINPRDSHHCKLLDPSEREPISQLLGTSILKAETGSSYRAPMEDVMNQLRELVRLNNSQGSWLVEQLYS